MEVRGWRPAPAVIAGGGCDSLLRVIGRKGQRRAVGVLYSPLYTRLSLGD